MICGLERFQCKHDCIYGHLNSQSGRCTVQYSTHPFHTMVAAFSITETNLTVLSGPTSSPIQPSGMPESTVAAPACQEERGGRGEGGGGRGRGGGGGGYFKKEIIEKGISNGAQ